MRRPMFSLVLGGLIAAFAISIASDARACHLHHKKACAAPTCEPCVAPVVVECPPPPPPCPTPKPCCHGGLFKKHSFLCHKPKCEPQPCIVAPCPAPAPPCPPLVWAPTASPQWIAPSMQSPMAPSKQGY